MLQRWVHRYVNVYCFFWQAAMRFINGTSVLVVVPLAARLAIGRQAGRKIPFLRLFALCMFVTVLTGGIVTALDSFFSSDATVMICFGFVISYIVLKCFCERSNESRRLYRVTLLKDGKRACATALYDTGNLLKKTATADSGAHRRECIV